MVSSVTAGRLEDEALPILLQTLFAAQSTGVLRIAARQGAHEIYFRQGFPVMVNLPGTAEPIGKVLHEMGVLDAATYKKSLAEPPPPGMRYGAVLIKKGWATAEQVRLGLKAQVRRKLHRLFFLNEGEFKYDEGEHREGMEGQESLRIHPWRAIYHGVRSAWSGDRLSGVLFVLRDRALTCSLDAAQLGRFGLGADDGRLGELLRRGYWRLEDLVHASGLAAQPVHALCYALYITESLKLQSPQDVALMSPGSVPTAAAAAPPVANPVAGAPLQTTSKPAVTPTLTPKPAAAPLDRAPAAPFDPQRPRGAATNAAPIDLGSLRKQVEAKAKVVDTENLFAVLGVPATATKDQIKEAYFQAAKRYHPDRIASMGLEALRPEVEKIFRRISEAYGTLYDDKQREVYRSTMSQPTDDRDAREKAVRLLEAEMACRHGDALLRQNEYQGAVRELEKAVAGNPLEGEHLALLTYARVCAGQSSYAQAKPVFTEALKLSPKCARAHFYLGLCFKEENELDRAYAMFRKALEIDQRLLEAEREMRLIQMRKEKGKSEKKGLFDRLRGK